MPLLTFREVVRMAVLPDAKEWTRTSVSLPDGQWKELDKLLDEENALRDPPERFTRDRLIHHLLEWAIREARAERKKKARP